MFFFQIYVEQTSGKRTLGERKLGRTASRANAIYGKRTYIHLNIQKKFVPCPKNHTPQIWRFCLRNSNKFHARIKKNFRWGGIRIFVIILLICKFNQFSFSKGGRDPSPFRSAHEFAFMYTSAYAVGLKFWLNFSPVQRCALW